MSKRRRRRVRFNDLGGAWADAHPDFPWYGIGWGWHVFLIWPAFAYGVSRILRAAWGQKSLPPQQQAQG